MKQLVIHKPGDYRQLKIESKPDPQPGTQQVLVEIQYAGINYADILIRWGVYKSAKKFIGWPITPGFEYSGIVKSVGTGVTRHKPGDRVFGVTLFGAYSSMIAIDQDLVYSLPQGFTLEQAAGFPAVYLTAFHALCQLVIIRPGSTILVHSAAGGVGTALLQLCRILGYRAIGVVGSSHKVETARRFGASEVIDKSKQDLWKEVERLVPNGCDIVLDANGVSTLKQSYEHTALSGKLMVYGFHSMLPKEGGRLKYGKLAWDYIRTPRFNPLDMTDKNRSLITFNLSFLFDRKELLEQGIMQLSRWVSEGKLVAPPVKVYPVEEAGEAHKHLESGQSVGKLVLKM